ARQGTAGVTDDGVLAAQSVAQVLEAVGGDQAKACSAAFLLVGGDLLALGGVDGVQVQQSSGGAAQGVVTQLAAVDVALGGVVVAAVAAAHGPTGGQFPGRLGRQLDPGDLVTGTLVVDEGSGAELAHRHEA